MNRIKCRAQAADNCFDGKPTSLQFGEDEPMSEDGTFLPDDQGGSIVCDPCYLLVCEFTPSGRGLHDELPAAIEAVQTNLRYLESHPDPQALADEAQRAMERTDVGQGTMYWRSANASRKLALAEVERRKH